MGSTLVQEKFIYLTGLSATDCQICGIRSFSHIHEVGTLPKDFKTLKPAGAVKAVGSTNELVVEGMGPELRRLMHIQEFVNAMVKFKEVGDNDLDNLIKFIKSR